MKLERKIKVKNLGKSLGKSREKSREKSKKANLFINLNSKYLQKTYCAFTELYATRKDFEICIFCSCVLIFVMLHVIHVNGHGVVMISCTPWYRSSNIVKLIVCIIVSNV